MPHHGTAKRQRDGKAQLPSSKRARLLQTGRQLALEKTPPLQHPRHTSPKRALAALLEPGPTLLDSFVSQWLESVGSDISRETRCRSDSCIQASTLIPRKRPRSLPDMSYRRDADGYAMPPPPSSEGTWSCTRTGRSVAPSDATATSVSGRSSSRSLVEHPDYRDENLLFNNISLRSSYDRVPDGVNNLMDYMRRDRSSPPGPSLEDIRQDRDLENLTYGASETEVVEYFRNKIYPSTSATDTLKRSDNLRMAARAVPNTDSRLKIGNPVPDMLYGYQSSVAFSPQQARLVHGDQDTRGIANSAGLAFPFFVIEFKGDGPTGAGSMWVAANQCLGGSATCVNISERLNRQLERCQSSKITQIDSAAFSVAMNGSIARLYISWKQNELDFYMRSMGIFLLQDPEHFLEFRKYVRNIIDWGRDKRLKEIRNSLDFLLEENRLRASAEAKSRQLPYEGTVADSSSSKRRK